MGALTVVWNELATGLALNQERRQNAAEVSIA